MRYRISFRDFIAGACFGLVIGTTSFSVASISYEGWNRLSNDYRLGYITGFLSLANLVRNFEPGGFLDLRYPLVPNAGPAEWKASVDELYKDPANQRYSIHSILQSAGQDLQKKFGKAMDPHQRIKLRMETQLAARRKRQEAAGIKANKPAPIKSVEAPKVAVPPKPKPARKWCRCDGKDPKAERAKRRAEAKKAGKAPEPATNESESGKAPDAAMKKGEAAKPPVPATNKSEPAKSPAPAANKAAPDKPPVPSAN